MENPHIGVERVDTPIQFAFNAGVLLTNPEIDGEQVLDDLKNLLSNMECDLDLPEIEDRFSRIEKYVGNRPLDKEGPVFESLVQNTVQAMLYRNNNDVEIDGSNEDDDLSKHTVALLDAFVSGVASGGYPAGHTKSIIKKEVRHEQKQLETKSSYAAVGAVKYLDKILDGLEITDLSIKAHRIVRGIKAVRVFGADIFTR